MNHSYRGKRTPVRFTGQHFLKSNTIIQTALQLAGLRSNDLVLDIGAGKGALTGPLSESAGKVIAIEQDVKLADNLESHFSHNPNVIVFKGDVRNFHLPKTPFKTVSNIPYSLTTQIFGKLLDDPKTPFMGGSILLEYGAAKRFTENDQTNPNIISWKTRYRLTIERTVSPSHFFPPPRVNSALLLIKRNSDPTSHTIQPRDYLGIIESLLKNPDEKISKALKAWFTWNQVNRICSDAELNKYQTVKSLRPHQWLTVYRAFELLVPRRTFPKPG